MRRAGEARVRALDALGSNVSVSAWVRMIECHTRVLSALRDELLPDCTMARFDLLAALEREDGQTLASLSRRLLVTAGNLTGLVDRAARDRLVVKKSDARDRRVSRVYLTRKGRALVEETIPRHARAVARTLSPLSAQEQVELRRILGKLRDGLRETQEDAPRPPPAARRAQP